MKKVLSIVLATMMVASVFAVNAGAVVPETETVVVTPAVPQDDIVDQDYSDTENNTEFVAHYSSLGTSELTVDPVDEENAVLKLAVSPEELDKALVQSVTKNTDIDANTRNMTVEFKVYPVGQAETIHVGNRMLTLLAGTDDADDKARDNYYVIGYPNFKANEWNTVKVEFHIPENYSVTNTSYPEYGNESSATITVNGNVLACVPGSAGKTATEGKYGVQANFTGASKPETITNLTYIGIGGVGAPTILEGVRAVYLDDVKVYIPGTPAVTEDVAYPITKGNIYLTDQEEKVLEGYDGAAMNNKGSLPFTTSAEAESYVLTFDAKNTVQGMPLVIHLGDKTHVGALNLASSEAIGTEWNTYKAVFNVNGAYVNPGSVYRLNEDGTYTALKYNVDWQNSRSGSTGKNQLIFYYTSAAATKIPPIEGIDTSKTVWEVKNVQVTDVMTFTGKATVDDEILTVNLNTCMDKATAMIVAVYDGERMVGANFVDAAIFADNATITVPYPGTIATPAVKLFIWDGMSTLNPLDVTLDITSAVAE